MDMKKIKIGLIIVLILLAVAYGVYVVSSKNDGVDLLTIKEKNKNVSSEFYDFTKEENKVFCIENVEEVEDGYIITANLLSEETRVISEEEYNNLLNGGKIEFRGLEWKSNNEFLEEKYLLIESGEDKLAVIKEGNEIVIENLAGIKSGGLRDYSGETKKIKVNKDVLIESFFAEFKYDENGTLKCYDIDGKEIVDSELTMEDLIELSKGCRGSYEECVVYARNGKVDAIQIFNK